MVSGEIINLSVDAIKDRFGKRSLIFTAGRSRDLELSESCPGFQWLTFSSVNLISIEQMKISRSLNHS
jgi:hypothetical protein